MIAMNPYAVMIVYFCNQYNFGEGGGPFHLSVFKCTVSVYLSFFVLENKVNFFTTNSVLYCSSMLTTAPILWPKLHTTCKLVYFKRFLRQGLRERESRLFRKSTPAVPDHHVTIPALFVHVPAASVASSLMHQNPQCLCSSSSRPLLEWRNLSEFASSGARFRCSSQVADVRSSRQKNVEERKDLGSRSNTSGYQSCFC